MAVKEKKLDAVILNPSHLVGSWDYHNWSQMISMVEAEKLPGVPPGLGSFCHIAEVAKAHIEAAHVGKTGENYILSGNGASFVKFVKVIGELLNKTVPQKPVPHWLLNSIGIISVFFARFTNREPDMTPEKVLIVCDMLKVSSKKAERELGYKTDISLEKMLSDCIEWMRQQKMIV